MTSAHYRPGTWQYVLRNGIAVVLSPETAPEAIRDLWVLLGRNPSVDRLLNEVTGSFGTSVTGLPDFAVVDHRGPLKLFLRGPLRVAVLDGDRSVADGRGVTTWNERSLPASASFEIAAGEPAAAGDSADRDGWLPLDSGVALASSLVVGELPAPGVVAAAEDDSTTADRPLFAADEATAAEEQDADDAGPAAHQETAATVGEAAGEETEPEAEDAGSGDTGPEISMEGTTDSLATELLGAREPEAETADEIPATGSGVEEPVAVAAPQEAPNDLTTTYDHLWDRLPVTGEETGEDRPGSPEPESTVLPRPDEPSQDEEAAQDGASAEPASEEPVPAGRPATVASPDGTAHTLLPAPEDSLIDEVPWASSSVPAAPAPPAAPRAAPPLPPAPPSFPPAPAVPSAPGATDDPDHDGHTVFRSEIGALGGQPAQALPVAAPAGDGPQVLARLCPRGHANPPTRSDCMNCGEAISWDAVSVARPPLGRLRLPSGETVLLDRNVILGRQPSVSRVSSGNMPHLIQLDSPKRDISRSHAEVRLEGWNVVLTDLNSSNGTVLLREGQSPRRLGQAETALLLSGDVAELGDQVYISFEDLP
ncbi:MULTISPECIES: FHA domain-containing protein [Arthrobacter]|uniref:FHA domain-containing protein n=2 Tax=Arthrobacter TaxID=1663 RepID=A0ABU9KPA2_9MICC|nr:FHA domain-containing protein [Arthrobacter sp. YJM1]MDP5228328.1 FHA domain-containing protein [Arthrobacter sp. YJM1]